MKINSQPLNPNKVFEISEGGVVDLDYIKNGDLDKDNLAAQLDSYGKIKLENIDFSNFDYEPTIVGPKILVTKRSYEYKLTNFNSFRNYSVSFSSGYASITNDTITVFPLVKGEHFLTVNGFKFQVTVKFGEVDAPKILSVNHGYQNNLVNLNILVSDFKAFPLPENQKSLDIEVYADPSLNLLLNGYENFSSTTNSSTVVVGKNFTTYFIRARYSSENYGYSEWSDAAVYSLPETLIGINDQDNFGFSCDVHNEGERFVVGSPNSSETSNNSGSLKIYKNSTVSGNKYIFGPETVQLVVPENGSIRIVLDSLVPFDQTFTTSQFVNLPAWSSGRATGKGGKGSKEFVPGTAELPQQGNSLYINGLPPYVAPENPIYETKTKSVFVNPTYKEIKVEEKLNVLINKGLCCYLTKDTAVAAGQKEAKDYEVGNFVVDSVPFTPLPPPPESRFLRFEKTVEKQITPIREFNGDYSVSVLVTEKFESIYEVVDVRGYYREEVYEELVGYENPQQGLPEFPDGLPRYVPGVPELPDSFQNRFGESAFLKIANSTVEFPGGFGEVEGTLKTVSIFTSSQFNEKQGYILETQFSHINQPTSISMQIADGGSVAVSTKASQNFPKFSNTYTTSQDVNIPSWVDTLTIKGKGGKGTRTWIPATTSYPQQGLPEYPSGLPPYKSYTGLGGQGLSQYPNGLPPYIAAVPQQGLPQYPNGLKAGGYGNFTSFMKETIPPIPVTLSSYNLTSAFGASVTSAGSGVSLSSVTISYSIPENSFTFTAYASITSQTTPVKTRYAYLNCELSRDAQATSFKITTSDGAVFTVPGNSRLLYWEIYEETGLSNQDWSHKIRIVNSDFDLTPGTYTANDKNGVSQTLTIVSRINNSSYPTLIKKETYPYWYHYIRKGTWIPPDNPSYPNGLPPYIAAVPQQGLPQYPDGLPVYKAPSSVYSLIQEESEISYFGVLDPNTNVWNTYASFVTKEVINGVETDYYASTKTGGMTLSLSNVNLTALTATISWNIEIQREDGTALIKSGSKDIGLKKSTSASIGVSGYVNGLPPYKPSVPSVPGYYKEEKGKTTTVTIAGTTYEFEGSLGDAVVEEKTLEINLGHKDSFGFSVAISHDVNNLVVVSGAPYDQFNSVLNAGGCFYSKFNQGNWSELNNLTVPSPAVGGNFGEKVDISKDGNTIFVSAPGVNRVYVYKNFVLAATISPATLVNKTRFGTQLSCSNDGKKIAVGYETGDVVSIFTETSNNIWVEEVIEAGVNMYQMTGKVATNGFIKIEQFDSSNKLIEILDLKSGDFNKSDWGISPLAVKVKISGTGGYEVLDGVLQDHDSTLTYLGRSFVFPYDVNNKVTEFILDVNTLNSGFGKSLSLSGNGEYLAVGVYSDTNTKGHARLIELSGLKRTCFVNPNTPTNNGFYGKSVCLSEDGLTLLVTEPGRLSNKGGRDIVNFKKADLLIDKKLERTSAEDIKTGTFGFSASISQKGKLHIVGDPDSYNKLGSLIVSLN